MPGAGGPPGGGGSAGGGPEGDLLRINVFLFSGSLLSSPSAVS